MCVVLSLCISVACNLQVCAHFFKNALRDLAMVRIRVRVWVRVRLESGLG